MIVLDASVLIAHFDLLDASHGRATTILDEHAGEGFLMSVVTRAEVLVRPARVGVLEQVESALEQLSVVTAGLDGDSAGALARLRSETDLRFRDCCVLLEAEG